VTLLRPVCVALLPRSALSLCAHGGWLATPPAFMRPCACVVGAAGVACCVVTVPL
jgi:hypothetical protein